MAAVDGLGEDAVVGCVDGRVVVERGRAAVAEWSRDMGCELLGLLWRFWSLLEAACSFDVLMWMWMGGSCGEVFLGAAAQLLCLPIGGGSIGSEYRLLRYKSGCV
jgi:hypothetical protein